MGRGSEGVREVEEGEGRWRRAKVAGREGGLEELTRILTATGCNLMKSAMTLAGGVEIE